MKNSLSIRGRYRIDVMNSDGSLSHSRGWRPNLLLDQGMNKLATVSFAGLFTYAAKGTGTTATKETPAGSNTYSLTSSTITRTAGTRDFTADDVGRLIRNADDEESIVTAFTDATHVDVRAVGAASLSNYTNKTITIYFVEQVELDTEVDRTGTYSIVSGENATTDGTGGSENKRTLKRTFVFDGEAENLEVVTGTYTWAVSTVTRSSGARDFTVDDVGKYIKFSSALYAKIATFTSATVVQMDRTGTASGSIEIYGFQEYAEFGLSDEEAPGANINIRVRLEDGSGNIEPIALLGANPETPGQQIKLTYEMEIAVTPNAATANAPAPITDPGNVMSSNKNFTSVVESMALSRIDPDGETNLEYAVLEPAIAGALGMSPSLTALSPFGNVDRTTGEVNVSMTNEDYVADSFQIVSRGTFELNDGIGTAWRSIGLVDEDSDNFVFTCLFAGPQKKDGEHSLTLSFLKSWNRDLS